MISLRALIVLVSPPCWYSITKSHDIVSRLVKDDLLCKDARPNAQVLSHLGGSEVCIPREAPLTGSGLDAISGHKWAEAMATEWVRGDKQPEHAEIVSLYLWPFTIFLGHSQLKRSGATKNHLILQGLSEKYGNFVRTSRWRTVLYLHSVVKFITIVN
jgi:hypothetical protein